MDKIKYLIILTLLIIPLVSSTDYYVSNTGDDGAAGTSPATAWKTLAKVQSETFNAGDNIYLNRGDIWRESLAFNGGSGTSSNPITFSSYGTGAQPRIYGSINESNWTSLGGNLYISSTNYPQDPHQMYHNTNSEPTPGSRSTTITGLDTDWEFYYNSTSDTITVYLSTGNPWTVGNGIEIPAIESASIDSLVYIQGRSYITFHDLEISYTMDNSISQNYGTGLNVSSCTFKYGYQKSIYTNADYSFIYNNTLYMCGVRGQAAPIGQSAQGECIWVARPDDKESTGIKVLNNVVQKCGGVCINLFQTNKAVVRYNNVFDMAQDYVQPEWAAGIYLEATDDSVVEYNNVTGHMIGIQLGNEQTGNLSKRNNISYNILIDNRIADMMITGKSAIGGYQVYNSTITQNTMYRYNNYSGSGFNGQVFFQYYNGINFSNNIVYNDYESTTAGNLLYAENGSTGTNYVSNYNLWNSSSGRNVFNFAGVDRTFSQYKTVSGQDANSITNNPLLNLVSFQPLVNSPVCNASSTGSYVGALPCQTINSCKGLKGIFCNLSACSYNDVICEETNTRTSYIYCNKTGCVTV